MEPPNGSSVGLEKNRHASREKRRLGRPGVSDGGCHGTELFPGLFFHRAMGEGRCFSIIDCVCGTSCGSKQAFPGLHWEVYFNSLKFLRFPLTSAGCAAWVQESRSVPSLVFKDHYCLGQIWPLPTVSYYYRVLLCQLFNKIVIEMKVLLTA